MMYKRKTLLMCERAGSFCLAVLILVLACTGTAYAKDSQNQVRIGVLAKRGSERCLAKWVPTAEYLSKEISGHSFKIIPLNFEEIIQAVEGGEVDFVLANSSIYVELEAFYGVSRIATLKNRVLGNVHTSFGGVIFRKACRDDINGLDDLKGKTFMAVKGNSFGGWRMGWYEMKQKGIDPYRDFKELLFGGTHDAVVYAVRDEKVDAGTVRSDTLERMVSEGKIRLQDFRVLGDHTGKDNAPFLHSTRLYPEWPMARVKHTSQKLAEEVAVALLNMPPDCPAAKAANCAGWTIPLNYQPVRDCLKELRVGPYKDFGKVTFGDVIRKYWYWLVIAAVLLVVMAVVTVYVLGLNNRLNRAKRELRGELVQREFAKKALRTEKDKLQILINGLADMEIGINIIGADYRILFQNAAQSERFGDLTGKLCYEGYMKRDKPCDSCPMQKALTGGNTKNAEVSASDGRRYEVLNAPLVNVEGTSDSVLEVLRDITDRKQVEENLKETLAEQERVNRLMAGREERVMELKKQINDLLEELGREKQFQTTA
jgi:phosphate/phosphite/phosphonate ABC transporter binding protein